MTETREVRLKRLKIRSWRRGTKEMDLILGGWSDAHLATLGDGDLNLYEAVLEENDHDLYQWVTGRAAAPEALRPLLDRIAREASRA
ncbi:MAG: succinate dehydrogenase assembly factor 2 [Pseudomonadota bacterium]